MLTYFIFYETLKSDEEMTVQVVSLRGEQLMQFSANGIEQIDLSALASGVYFLKCTTNDLRTKTLHIIKS